MKKNQRGFIGGVAEAIIFIVAIGAVLLYLYSKYPAQFKNFISNSKPGFSISPSPAGSPTPTPIIRPDELGRLLTICQSIPNGKTTKIIPTTRLYVNLPSVVYPKSGLTIANTSTASASIMSNETGLYRSKAFTDNCWSHYYEFNGSGTTTFSVKSVQTGIPDYQIYFKVLK